MMTEAVGPSSAVESRVAATGANLQICSSKGDLQSKKKRCSRSNSGRWGPKAKDRSPRKDDGKFAELTQAEYNNYKRIFTTFDANSSGTIGAEELWRVMDWYGLQVTQVCYIYFLSSNLHSYGVPGTRGGGV